MTIIYKYSIVNYMFTSKAESNILKATITPSDG